MSNWIYKNNDDNSARFVLGEIGKKNLVCFGINPSTAEPNNLDNTLKTVKKVSGLHGYDGWIMLNVYPQRATNPNDMHKLSSPGLHAENLSHIQDVFESGNTDIWCAWGTLINKRPYLREFLTDIARAANGYDCKWLTIGKRSISGDPHHPLYLRHDSPVEQFDIKRYLGIR